MLDICWIRHVKLTSGFRNLSEVCGFWREHEKRKEGRFSDPLFLAVNKPCMFLMCKPIKNRRHRRRIFLKKETNRYASIPVCLFFRHAWLVILLCSSIMFHDAAQLLRSCGRVSHDDSCAISLRDMQDLRCKS